MPRPCASATSSSPTTERNLRIAAERQRSATLLLLAIAGTRDDAVMIAAARTLRQCTPSSGVLGLTEDRDFVILLPDLTLDSATELAARMQSEVAAALPERSIHVGGATSPDATASAQDLWTAAEQALRDAEGNVVVRAMP